MEWLHQSSAIRWQEFLLKINKFVLDPILNMRKRLILQTKVTITFQFQIQHQYHSQHHLYKISQPLVTSTPTSTSPLYKAFLSQYKIAKIIFGIIIWIMFVLNKIHYQTTI